MFVSVWNKTLQDKFLRNFAKILNSVYCKIIYYADLYCNMLNEQQSSSIFRSVKLSTVQLLFVLNNQCFICFYFLLLYVMNENMWNKLLSLR